MDSRNLKKLHYKNNWIHLKPFTVLDFSSAISSVRIIPISMRTIKVWAWRMIIALKNFILNKMQSFLKNWRRNRVSMEKTESSKASFIFASLLIFHS
jgi:hypothetical protein